MKNNKYNYILLFEYDTNISVSGIKLTSISCDQNSSGFFGIFFNEMMYIFAAKV